MNATSLGFTTGTNITSSTRTTRSRGRCYAKSSTSCQTTAAQLFGLSLDTETTECTATVMPTCLSVTRKNCPASTTGAETTRPSPTCECSESRHVHGPSTQTSSYTPVPFSSVRRTTLNQFQ